MDPRHAALGVDDHFGEEVGEAGAGEGGRARAVEVPVVDGFAGGGRAEAGALGGGRGRGGRGGDGVGVGGLRGGLDVGGSGGPGAGGGGAHSCGMG